MISEQIFKGSQHSVIQQKVFVTVSYMCSQEGAIQQKIYSVFGLLVLTSYCFRRS